jgi:low affinity Fe/Cu permease
VAGVTVACLLVAWGVVGIVAGFPSWWQVALYSTTSAVTVVMVFAIQHTQHREQLVTQRKLDELVRSQPGADDRLIAAEAATDAELDDLI